jgi:hypothetical protein
MGGQVALARPHMMKASGNELTKPHKAMGFRGRLIWVVGGGREGEVPILQDGLAGLFLKLSVSGFNRGEWREGFRQMEANRRQTCDPF